MTKQEKVSLINEALQNSEFAMEKGVRAEILSDGRIQYSREYGNQWGSRMKISYREAISFLHGTEMRRINAAIKGK